MHVYCINNIKRIFNEESSASRIFTIQENPLNLRRSIVILRQLNSWYANLSICVNFFISVAIIFYAMQYNCEVLFSKHPHYHWLNTCIWHTIWTFFQHHKTPENIIFINLIFLSRVYWIKDTRKCEWFKDLSLLKKKLDNPCFQTSFKLAKIFPVFFDGINYSGNKSDFLILILSACGIHPIC